MATYTPKRLGGPTTLANTTTTDFYTAPTGGAVVKQLIFTNITTAAATISVQITADGTTPANATAGAVVYLLSVSPNSQLIWSADIPLSSGEHVWVKAGSSSAINVTATGIEIA